MCGFSLRTSRKQERATKSHIPFRRMISCPACSLSARALYRPRAFFVRPMRVAINTARGRHAERPLRMPKDVKCSSTDLDVWCLAIAGPARWTPRTSSRPNCSTISIPAAGQLSPREHFSKVVGLMLVEVNTSATGRFAWVRNSQSASASSSIAISAGGYMTFAKSIIRGQSIRRWI